MFKFKDIQNGMTNVTGLSKELEAIYINDLYQKKQTDILVVTSSIYEANKLYNSLRTYNTNVFLYLMDDFMTSEASISSPELEINRIETLNEIVFNNNKNIVITNLMGFLRYIPNKNIWKNSKIDISINDEINKDELFRKLCNYGYNVETLVTKTGEISNRGYILDIFPINEETAVRLEFFGDVVESIRLFDVNTQLSTKTVDNISINAATEFICDKNIDEEYKKQKYLPNFIDVDKLINYLNDAIIIYKDYSQIYNSYLILEEDIVNYNKANNKNLKYMHNLEEMFSKCEIYISSVDSMLPQIKINETHNYTSYEAPNYNDNIELLNSDLKTFLNTGKTVIICLNTRHQIDNIRKYLEFKVNETDFSNIRLNSINVVLKEINEGYIFDNLIVLGVNNLFKISESKSHYKTKFKYGVKVANTDALTIGDYVVHNMHGIGIYQGIVALKKGNIVKDYLQIKYKDDGKLYIPVEKIELISKYSSNEENIPKLNKLGSTDWQKTKIRISGRLKNIADELIKIAVSRKANNGFSFRKDTEEQALFESEFVYNETIDQLKAIETIKSCMEENSPMDILLCGDVGYGKTEVAFRAIFKAVCSNKQVAYLCPTTLLSNQQYNSCIERFKSFPVNIALLNRFTTKKEADNIISKLKTGQIDILFGTHRILSDDIGFKDLGLLVIDEEQRFGVTHKEKIKQYKSNIDVLTLSATPIPRTLQMSMVGIRNLVLIETPPSDRFPVQTYVLEENMYIIRDAIYKELARDGQVYILCNRIESFEQRIHELEKIIPDIKIGCAHGKMNKNEIEDIMFKFMNKEFDVLLCTTIIETGIDISNVNTLIILDADKFGLSQLYQIRGRVGRTNRIAYAYLMYSKRKVLSEVATKRLSAIKEFAQLGSGFRIAMRDLAIRGAGDVLGSEQSGFIDSIGIELYLKMLNDEVNRVKGIEINEEENDEPPSLTVATHIDNSYVNDDKLKMEIHKMINKIDSYQSLIKIKAEIEDRFGKIDESLLIYMYEEWFESLKGKKGIEKVVQTDKFIKLVFSEETTNKVDASILFVNAYKISKNFKLGYANKRIELTLSINNLDKHWIYYLVEIANIL